MTWPHSVHWKSRGYRDGRPACGVKLGAVVTRESQHVTCMNCLAILERVRIATEGMDVLH
jgi:hypothetical protein